MTATSITTRSGTPAAFDSPSPSGKGVKHWFPLLVLALAQLMVVLDGTVVNVALPDAQRALGISDADRTWVVTAYALAFGGLLLLGGRIADYWGRKRSLTVGLLGFAAASAVGGAAVNGPMLFGARAVQGIFAALLAPAALSMISVIYTGTKERATALSVYGAVAGSGAAIGLLLGGALTSYLSWRWSLFVNTPIALFAVIAGSRVLPADKGEPGAHYDIPGALLVTGGLASLVYGFTEATSHGWSSATTLGFLGVGVALIAAFVITESQVGNPLLPLRILLDRNRGGAYLVSALSGAGFIGAILFVTYYMQTVLGYSPVRAGASSLPLAAGVVVTATLAGRLMPKLGPKPLMVLGSLLAMTGLLLLTTIGVDSSYVTHLLAPMIIIGMGLGWIFVPVSTAALNKVQVDDAGVASAIVNATQQVGSSIGSALLNTLYASAVSTYLATHAKVGGPDPHALVHGYTVAFTWGAVIVAIAVAASVLLLRRGRMEAPEGTVVLA